MRSAFAVSILLLLLFVVILPPVWAATPAQGQPGAADTRMSAMGQFAARARAAVAARQRAALRGEPCGAGDCENENEGPAGGQAETSIAVDATGQHVVIGFNDTRGFSKNPLSVSGYMYSDDGGKTFVDGGQLPSPGNESIGTTLFPQVFGDPDVKYLGACTFIYSSILVTKFSDAAAAQTMGVHRSTDCGHTWVGPFVVTPATNPHGGLDQGGNPRDAGDKEFIDIDPDTGRVLMSWSNFTPFAPGGVEISTSYSDDITATPPTWSPRVIAGSDSTDGQSAVPRFAGNGSPNAYLTWRRFNGLFNTIAFARSTDNGATWSAPVNIAPFFKTMDQVLGNDRVNTSPSMAVDVSPQVTAGNVYIVYTNNDANDGGDVVFQRSTDAGLTFSPPLFINARPGHDRAQWFPWVAVDKTTARVSVFYYDQKIAYSGDRSEVSLTWSDDAGKDWIPQRPLTTTWFKAGWGNDTGQPNLGDYNQSVAQGGEIFFSFAVAERPPAGFVDGQPSLSMTVPDVAFRRVGKRLQDVFGVAPLDTPLRPLWVETTDHEREFTLDIPLRNYVTNPLNAAAQTAISTLLVTDTPGVHVLQPLSTYPNIPPGQIRDPNKSFVIELESSFVPGTAIHLDLLALTGRRTTAEIGHYVFTATNETTTLIDENFENVAPGTLPAGWRASHGAGANVVPWTTTTGFCGNAGNAAFHPDAIDGPPGGSPSRWERLFSPAFDVPADSDYVTLDFDVCYDTEDDPNFRVLAYDGAFLRVTDLTPGHTLRSVLAEAFEDIFFTDDREHYPKHFPRSGDRAYFEDMSAWAGDSGGVRHVRMRLPGMAGTTAQLRFEYTQDVAGTCADVRPGHTCGISIDNVVVKSVVSKTK